MTPLHHVFFHGVWPGTQGHHLYDVRGAKKVMLLPWPSLDCVLCPNDAGPFVESTNQIEGDALLHHKYGWTALAFWDQSGDPLPGSHSVLVAHGTLSFDEMRALIATCFPYVHKRITFPLKQVIL